jgi:hypothetical protein
MKWDEKTELVIFLIFFILSSVFLFILIFSFCKLLFELRFRSELQLLLNYCNCFFSSRFSSCSSLYFIMLSLSAHYQWWLFALPRIAPYFTCRHWLYLVPTCNTANKRNVLGFPQSFWVSGNYSTKTMVPLQKLRAYICLEFLTSRMIRIFHPLLKSFVSCLTSPLHLIQCRYCNNERQDTWFVL